VFLKDNPTTGMAMVRKAAHDRIGGYTEEQNAGLEDWDYWLKFAEHGMWGGTVPEPMDWNRRQTAQLNGQSPSKTDPENARKTLRARYPRTFSGGLPASIQPVVSTALDERFESYKANVVPRVACRRRLLLIAPWMMTGGADRFNIDAIKSLKARGWDVTVALTLNASHVLEAEFRMLTPEVFVLPRFLPSAAQQVCFLQYLMQSRHPDVVMVSNSELGYQALAQLRAFGAELPTPPNFVDYVHMEEEAWNDGGYARMSVDMQDHLDAHLVASRHLAGWMVTRGLRTNNVHTCYVGTDVDLFAADWIVRANVRAQLKIAIDDPVLLYACRITAQKQPFVFAETMRLLAGDSLGAAVDSRLTVLVAGDGPDLPALRERLNELGSSTRVRILVLGELPQQRVRELMQASDILFLPSEMEGIALVQMESMAAGMVFVGADVGGQAEVITPSCECGVLVPRSQPDREAQRYAEYIHRLVQEPERRQKIGAAAAARIRASFSSASLGCCLESGFFEGQVACSPRKYVGWGFS
jgi:glycosyltransferase involved in cell wall biosynthesis